MESWEYFESLFSDKNQYVTWALVFLGWCVSFILIRVQSQDSKKLSCEERVVNYHNENVILFKEKLSMFEDFCLDFWSIKNVNEPDPQIALIKIASKLKVLTEIARDIEKFNGKEYPKGFFKTLRRFTSSDNELPNRPLNLQSLQITTIRQTCSALRKYYNLAQ